MAPEHRDRARALLGGHESGLRGFAYVLGGRGLRAKLVRGAMNAVLMSVSFDARTFSSNEDAVRWLLARPDQSPALRNCERALLDAIGDAI